VYEKGLRNAFSEKLAVELRSLCSLTSFPNSCRNPPLFRRNQTFFLLTAIGRFVPHQSNSITMALINPHMAFNGNAEEAFNFYKSVFGGEFATVVRF